jgi:cell division protease FtsH
MGGRAAEKIVIHDVTQGAVGDIQQATKIAKYMVTRFGMSELGPVCYGDSQEIFVGRGYQQTVDYSEQTAAKIDAEVSRLVNEGYEKAYAILTENRDKLDTMARVLIECETIGTEEVDMIMAGATPAEVKDALEKRLSAKYERKKNSANEN